MPFDAFNPDINSVFSGQLSGSTNESSADAILKFDPVLKVYTSAHKAASTGDEFKDGRWFSNFSTWTPSTLRFLPGEGFWIRNRQAATQTVFLTGDVLMDATNTVALSPALNLFGYPFSSGRRFAETELARTMGGEDEITDPTPGPPAFSLGRGYWYNRRSETCLVWSEVRPYADLFPTNEEPPLVEALNVVGGGQAVRLRIRCEGTPGERLDIFYQDAGETNRFDTAGPWQLAAADLAANGTNVMEWSDWGGDGRRPVDQVAGRYYLVGRADILGADGVAVARARFLGAGGPDSGLPGSGGGVGTSGNSTGTNQVQQGAGGTNGAPPVLVAARIMYVDRRVGGDQLSGRSPIVVGVDGPKLTIRSGISAANGGDTVLIKTGRYGEDLHIGGRAVSVRIEGHVNLSGRRAAEPVSGSPSGTSTNSLR